jgi:hypothetical protein
MRSRRSKWDMRLSARAVERGPGPATGRTDSATTGPASSSKPIPAGNSTSSATPPPHEHRCLAPLEGPSVLVRLRRALARQGRGERLIQSAKKGNPEAAPCTSSPSSVSPYAAYVLSVTVALHQGGAGLPHRRLRRRAKTTGQVACTLRKEASRRSRPRSVEPGRMQRIRPSAPGTPGTVACRWPWRSDTQRRARRSSRSPFCPDGRSGTRARPGPGN